MLRWRAALLASPSHGEVSDDIRIHGKRTLQRRALPPSYNAVARLQGMQPHLLLTMRRHSVGDAAERGRLRSVFVCDGQVSTGAGGARCQPPASAGRGRIADTAALHSSTAAHSTPACAYSQGTSMHTWRINEALERNPSSGAQRGARRGVNVGFIACVGMCKPSRPQGWCRSVRAPPFADSALPSVYASNQLRVCNV